MRQQAVLFTPASRQQPSATRSANTIALTDRDIRILYALHAARYMSTPQIQTLFWRASRGGRWGRQKACSRRLRQLTTAGLVRRIEQPVTRAEATKPYIYALGRRGAELLCAEMDLTLKELAWQTGEAEHSFPFLQHLLLTTDIRIALSLGCEAGDSELAEWIDERELKCEDRKDYVRLRHPNGRTERAAVVPDACFTLRSAGRQALFFLEVDLGTVTVAPSIWSRRGWARKVRAYRAYFESDVFHKRFGRRPAVVLTVTTSAKRLQHLKEATEREGGDAHFWFGLLAEATDPAAVLRHPFWRVSRSKETAALLNEEMY